MNYQFLCEQVCTLAKNTGKFLKQEVSQIQSKDIQVKGLHDFVTYVDKSAEEKIVSDLIKLIPNAGFIAEENTVSIKGEEYNWIIDPLDGTTNFIHGIPCYAISIALMKNNIIVVGVVYEINLDECFYAWEGGAAYLNGKQIFVSEKKNIADSLIATGFPYYDYSRLDEYMNIFIYFLKNSHGVRRLGSAAVDLVYVACGRFEGFYEYGLRPWDVAAGAFIVQKAGGTVYDFSGQSNYLFGKEIVASNNLISEDFNLKIQSFFKNKDLLKT